jgi:hypothetical protein
MSRFVLYIENTSAHHGTIRQDERYFRKHPQADHYIRLATPEECRDFGLVRGTKVVVVKLSKHRHARLIQGPPDERRN